MKALFSLLLLSASLGVAQADDHVIKPTCWEENITGKEYRR
jgi:hypothetical protein